LADAFPAGCLPPPESVARYRDHISNHRRPDDHLYQHESRATSPHTIDRAGLGKREDGTHNQRMTAAAPPGTILTFLIADVRGYTTFTQSRGDEAAAHLASTFAEIAQEGVEGHGGDVIELRGDEALAVFQSAREALRAAVALQLTFADEVQLDGSLPLLVGIGLDAGEAVRVDGGYRGGALNLAARLCSQAKAGEVLVSQGVVHLARAVDGIRLHDHGALELKGLTEPVRVFRAAPGDADPDELVRRVQVDGRPAPQRSELPAALDPVTPMIGRDRDVRRLRWAWRAARRGEGGSIFIAGPPGIGKTRLAAEGAGTAAAGGAAVTYRSFADSSADGDHVAKPNGRPIFAVVDDLDGASADERDAALELAARARGTSSLVVVAFDDESASPELLAAVRRLAGDDRVVRPQPLGLDQIRRIAALYLGDAVDALPSGLLESTGGVPRRVHEQVSEWAHAEAAKRLGVFASQAAADRSDLRSVEGEIASSVVDLQLVLEQARLFGAGPGRGAPESVEPPYKGLASFDVDDAEWFYGRERLVAELIARLAGAPLLGVVGPSGSGKSSALRAGLVPALQAGVLPRSDEWAVVLMRPGEHPLRALDRALWSTLPESLREALAGEDRPLRAARDVLADGERVVLVIDQFEEVFTLCTDEKERTAFLSAIVEAAADPRANELVMLALRADYYGRCAANPELAELLGANHVLVGPMTAEEYRRAIEQPALHAGVRIEPALVDELVGEVLGEPGALPLLSTALLDLWQRRDGRTIRAGERAATGGVRGAVARLADEAYAGLSDAEKPIVRRVLLRLAGPGEGENVARRRVPLSEFDAERNAGVARVLDILAERRLLTVSEGSVEVAHEALLREWPRFQEWLEEDREGRRLHAHLTATAREWADRGHDPSELYRAARLTAALDWTTEHTLELNELERDFVNASRVENERDLVEQRRRNRRLRLLLAGTGALLVFAVIAGAVALAQRASAKREARVALARELGAEAVAEPRIDRAMLLAREAVNLDKSRQTAGTLLATLLRTPSAIATFSSPITDRPQRITLSPDGRTLVVVENTSLVRFYDTRTRRERRPPLPNAPHFPVTFARDGRLVLLFRSPSRTAPPGIEVLDGRTLRHVRFLPLDKRWLTTPTSFEEPLLISPDDRTAYLVYAVVNSDQTDGPVFVDRWDIASGKLLGTSRLPWKGIFAGRVAPDGKLVLLTDNAVLTLDGKTLRPVRSLPVHIPESSTPALATVSPDGTRIATGLLTGAVSFVDVRTGETIAGAGKTGVAVQAMAFSPRGDVVVTTNEKGQVTVWNPNTADVVETFTGHEDRTLGIAFSADGKTFFTCSLDGAIFEWDLGNHRRFGRAFEAYFAPNAGTEHAPSLALSPDGQTFATSPGGNRVALMSLRTRRREHVLTALPRGGTVTAIAWSPKGSLLAVGGKNELRLWNMSARPRRVRSLRGLHGTVQQVAFSPDGSLVAGVDGDHSPGPAPPTGHFAVWHVGSGALVTSPLDLHTLGWTVAFTPDGKSVVAGDDNGAVRVFDARSVHRVRTLHLLGGTNTSLAFAPDGTLATGSWAGIVQRWDVTSGKQLGHPVLAVASPVASISFDPSGDEFATAPGSGGFVKLWDTKTLQQLGTAFPGEPGRWAVATFTPNGADLVTMYDNGRGTVWPATLRAWEDHACRVAGRNLTREEWSRYVTGRSYANVCS
jgi:WD40 repeat protein/class 3 adenylate cyclase